jgi:hypothetical protein
MKVQSLMTLLALVGFGYAQPTVVLAADAGWTSAPVLLPAPAKGDRRTQSLVEPANLTSKQVVVFPPFGGATPPEPWTAEPQDGKTVNIKSHGEGNYHWVVATDTEGKRIASTTYYFANPGAAPRNLLQQDTAALEIKPVKLPREHSQFQSKDTWFFQAIYQGQPLPNASVKLDTSNGTHQTLSSDAEGQVRVKFPDDFGVAVDAGQHVTHGENQDGGHGGGGHEGHGMGATAQFALSVEHAGITGAFNYKYEQDAFTNKAVLPALGFVFGGMLLASPLLWRRKKA